MARINAVTHHPRLFNHNYHHFYIDYEGPSLIEVDEWLEENATGYWLAEPEVVAEPGHFTGKVKYHVTIESDRDAMLFKLAW